MDKFITKLQQVFSKCSKTLISPFSVIGINAMTKEEALKILNIKEKEMSVERIMKQSKEYIEANDPMKGGSFYIQNKVFHAREALLRLYKYDKGYNGMYNKGNSKGDKRNAMSSKVKEEMNNLNNKH